MPRARKADLGKALGAEIWNSPHDLRVVRSTLNLVASNLAVRAPRLHTLYMDDSDPAEYISSFRNGVYFSRWTIVRPMIAAITRRISQLKLKEKKL